ncbi:MAG: sulfotransferase domain-containing protein [bacterium]|nr:sulfotransferase domain-containing protein [bacterium]
MNTQLFGYFGHHKSASSWISRQIIKPAAEAMDMNYIHYSNPAAFERDIKKHLQDHQVEFFAYVNADSRDVGDVIHSIKGFHVVRDPRDICISAYFSHRYSHSTTVKYSDHIAQLREKLAGVSIDEGLMLEMDFLAHVYGHMEKWDYSLPNILELKFENLANAPYRVLLEVFDFLGLIPGRISGPRFLEIIYEKRFDKMSGGRQIGEENAQSHYRKGIVGDWKNYFKEQHRTVFKERFNPLLVKLGYETDDRW